MDFFKKLQNYKKIFKLSKIQIPNICFQEYDVKSSNAHSNKFIFEFFTNSFQCQVKVRRQILGSFLERELL